VSTRSISIFTAALAALLVIGSYSPSKVYADAMHGDKPVRGWFWYEDPVREEPQKKVEIPKVPLSKEPEMKVEKKDFEFPVLPDAPPILATMLKDPTEENATAYLDWQFQYFQHLKKIGYNLHHAYLKWGADVYPISGYPDNVVNSLHFRMAQQEAEERIINNLHDKVGIIYFYAKDDPTCITQKRVLRAFLEEVPLSIRGVSYDGNIDTELPFMSVYKPSLFSDYNIQKIPTLMAVVDVPEGVKTLYLGVGLTSVGKMRSQIINFLIQEGLIKEKDINPTFISTHPEGYQTVSHHD
jgi:thiol-disulfide isomerase/thioredoxin